MMNELTVNRDTGEVIDSVVRPFAELLSMFDHGSANAEASRALHDVISAVQDTGKAGSVTIKVNVKPIKANTEQVLVSAQIATKMPTPEPASSIFYVDQTGNLTRNDPRQHELDYHNITMVEPTEPDIVNRTDR